MSPTEKDHGITMYKVLGNGVFQMDTDVIRRFARELTTRANTLTDLARTAETIPEAVVQGAGEFVAVNEPAPIYKETVTSVEKTAATFKETLATISSRLNDDASGLLWIADNLEQGQDHLAREIGSVDVNSHNTGNPGTGVPGTGGPGSGATGTDNPLGDKDAENDRTGEDPRPA